MTKKFPLRESGGGPEEQFTSEQLLTISVSDR